MGLFVPLFKNTLYDDKAGIVLMLAAVEALIRSGARLKGDLILGAMADDESSGDGFGKFSTNGIYPDACLMLDGAKVHQIGYAHAGCIWYRLEVRGSTTACNNKASNAVEKTILILNQLFELANRLNEGPHGPYSCYEKPIRLNVCKIAGGEWLGNNAAHCLTEFSLNFILPERLDSVKQAIVEAVDTIVRSDSWLQCHPPVLEQVYMAFDPYECPLDCQFYKIIESAHLKMTGQRLEPRVITGWFHGPAFACPCFLYGPGDGGASHGVDEYFTLSSFDRILPPLVEIMRQWCGIAE